ncbi:MAG: motility protein MotB [Methylococcaceae bacterium]|nr:MAG: motility protein MotB [Methylococcaceae bacterium]
MEGQPIVVKRVKKVIHGSHGGAWKVAFADFVTALMAFFMVMWLTSSSTPEQKAAISRYFNDPYGMGTNKSAGEGPGGSSSNVIPSTGNIGASTSVIQMDAAHENPDTPETSSLNEISKEQEKKTLEELKDELKNEVQASQSLAPFKDQLLIDITPEGLRIQIVDKENRPMFALGSPTLETYSRNILRELAGTIAKVPNRVSITGHTDATPFLTSGDYSNWELSSDRANAARRELTQGGLPEDKIARVVGLSDSMPLDKTNPLNPINRRINLIVMTKEAEAAALKSESNTISPSKI